MNNNLLSKLILIFVLTLNLSTAAFAQGKDALYVYRNDGIFTALNFVRVDSLVCSKLSIDSVECSNYVTQEIYTRDSVYRIPLAVIDSVCFHPLETIYKREVVKIDDFYDYVTSADSLQLTMSHNGVEFFSKGDILLYEKFDDKFPDGFAGRVSSIDAQGGQWMIKCDYVSMDDVYDQLLILGDEYDETVMHAKSENGEDLKAISLDFDVELRDGPIFLEGKANATFAIDPPVVLKQWGQYSYVGVSGTWSVGVDVSTGAKIDGDLKLPKKREMHTLVKGIPIPGCPLLQFKVKWNECIILKGSVDVSLSKHFSVKGRFFGSKLHDDYHASNGIIEVDDPDVELSLNLEGSVKAGVTIFPYFTGLADWFRFGLKAEVGPQYEASFSLTPGDAWSLDTYRILKDTKVTTCLDAELMAVVGVNIFNFEKALLSLDLRLLESEHYLLPEMSKPLIGEKGRNYFETQSTPSRDLLLPVHVGLGVFDMDDNLIDKYYCPEKYWTKPTFKEVSVYNKFSNLTPGIKYVCRPLVDFFSIEMPTDEETEVELGVPVEVKSVQVTKANYYPQHFQYNGALYDFKYNCATLVELLPEAIGVTEWGYIYYAPEGGKAKIPVTESQGEYLDKRYAYCRNDSHSSITFAPYVKYEGSDQVIEGQPVTFDIVYPPETSIKLSDCTFQGTSSNVAFEGHTYKHKSTFRYLFSASGAYWLQVRTIEQGSGWNGWSLPETAMTPVDGSNALTVNYYYDDANFNGDFTVRLHAQDWMHAQEYNSTGYVTYLHSGDQFTGCQVHGVTSAPSFLNTESANENNDDNSAIINIVINKY